MEDFQFEALPLEQRIAKQQELKNKGLYAGALDGRLGPQTRQALALARTMERRTPQGDPVRMRELELQAERERRAAEAKTRREQEASLLWDVAIPATGGALVGGAYGELANRALNRFDTGNANALAEIANELGPTRKLTNSQLNRSRAMGAAEAAQRFAPQTTGGKIANATGRLASYAIPAAAIMNEYRRYQAMADDPNLSETERMANQRLANAFLGVGTGIGVEGGRRFFFPSRPPGAGRAEMRIQTARDLAQRMDQADATRALRAPQAASAAEDAVIAMRAAPEPVMPVRAERPLQPALPAPAVAAEAAETPALLKPEIAGRSHSDRLISAAKAGGGANIRTKRQAAKWLAQNVAFLPAKERAAIAAELGVNRGPKFVPRLKEAISKMASRTGRFGILAPLAGAAVGWEMSGDQAQASTGDASGGSDLRRKAEGAAIGGGATAGTMYGLRKLAETPVGQMISKGATGLAGVSLPSTIDAMTDYSPEERETGRQFLARNLPEWAQSTPIRAAGVREQMGLTPEETDAAFEQALAQFEAMHQQPQQPAMSPLERIVSAPTGPARMMAQNALQGWR